MMNIVGLLVASTLTTFAATTSPLPLNPSPPACSPIEERIVVGCDQDHFLNLTGDKIKKAQISFNNSSDSAELNIDLENTNVVNASESADTQFPDGKHNKIKNSSELPVDPGKQLDREKLFILINEFRHAHGLPNLVKEPFLCQLAEVRVKEIYDEIMIVHRMHQGLRVRDIPYIVSENLIRTNSEEKAMNWWINSPIHLKTLLSDNKYSCGACQGNSCTQLFSNFTPRETSGSAKLARNRSDDL
jgi:uncharacterized protein YkwD